jgi:hypothetical protein
MQPCLQSGFATIDAPGRRGRRPAWSCATPHRRRMSGARHKNKTSGSLRDRPEGKPVSIFPDHVPATAPRRSALMNPSPSWLTGRQILRLFRRIATDLNVDLLLPGSLDERSKWPACKQRAISTSTKICEAPTTSASVLAPLKGGRRFYRSYSEHLSYIAAKFCA